MILSLKYNFLFIHVPRVAGKAMTNVLVPYGDLFGEGHSSMIVLRNKLLTGGYFYFLVDDTLGIKPKRLHCNRFACIEKRFFKMNQKEYDNLFKFVFVRNPWGRLLSAYFLYKNRPLYTDKRKEVENKTFGEWVESIYNNPNTTKPLRTREKLYLQVDMLADEKGNLLVDFIGRFENLQNDFNKVCSKVKLPELMLPNIDYLGGKYVETRNFDDYKSYYNDKTKRIVSELYKKDIEFFNYEFKE